MAGRYYDRRTGIYYDELPEWAMKVSDTPEEYQREYYSKYGSDDRAVTPNSGNLLDKADTREIEVAKADDRVHQLFGTKSWLEFLGTQAAGTTAALGASYALPWLWNIPGVAQTTEGTLNLLGMYQGAKGLTGKHGVSETIDLFRKGLWKEGTGSLIGDAGNLAMTALPAYSTIQKGLRLADRYELPIYPTIIPNKNHFYRQVDGAEAIKDAILTGHIRRMPHESNSYDFAYFTKGDLYSKQNSAYDFGDRARIIVGKNQGNIEFAKVKDGVHEVLPEEAIRVGDSATPMFYGNEAAAPASNFYYFEKGTNPISRFFYKKRSITPFSTLPNSYGSLNLYRGTANPDSPLLGKAIGDGSESYVFEDPTNANRVLKVYTDLIVRSLSELERLFNNYVLARNAVPYQEPIHIEGVTSEGFPVFSQQKLSVFSGDNFNSKIASSILKNLKSKGFDITPASVYDDVVTTNGAITIGDFLPHNVGFDKQGNLKFFDIDSLWVK